MLFASPSSMNIRAVLTKLSSVLLLFILLLLNFSDALIRTVFVQQNLFISTLFQSFHTVFDAERFVSLGM